ncbi:DUF1292 domain-containing protein [Paenibacillus albiflavus]|uniref:DUF1292 domain-containing protein n=1 Tax=Paenibacillus albiflavus TaxID=2545760 RepID=A0A4R4EGE7_9BACL|nr:DUF1292 domain-containing protein [Paenibacillus albiflavus]TCZ77208.1 DUF1292 domain-containing protein [Paenibacillus albiflavus]
MSVTPIDVLRNTYGDDIILTDEQDESVVFRLMMEFEYNARKYAVLQSDEMQKDDEVELFRIAHTDNGYELETIDDDDEWETVSELYDEIAFPMKDEL